MALSNGPNLGLLVNAAQGEAHFAEQQRLLRGLDALVQPSVKDKDLATPPPTPADGDRYIVAAAPTGVWVGHAGEIARWSSVAAVWEFYVPKAGWRMYVVDEAVIYTYTGAIWSATLTRRAVFSVLRNSAPVDPTSFWPDATSVTGYFLTPVPDDYVSGHISIKINRRGAGTGTARMDFGKFRIRDATAIFVEGTGPADFTPGDTLTHTFTLLFPAGTFQLGDYLRLNFQRQGGEPADTMLGAVSFDGAWIEYTGRA